MMKSLGYARLISVDNFRQPNFELVADILYWMVHRYTAYTRSPAYEGVIKMLCCLFRIDPFADISDDISTEDKRVIFLKSVATLMVKYNTQYIRNCVSSLTTFCVRCTCV